MGVTREGKILSLKENAVKLTQFTFSGYYKYWFNFD